MMWIKLAIKEFLTCNTQWKKWGSGINFPNYLIVSTNYIHFVAINPIQLISGDCNSNLMQSYCEIDRELNNNWECFKVNRRIADKVNTNCIILCALSFKGSLTLTFWHTLSLCKVSPSITFRARNPIEIDRVKQWDQWPVRTSVMPMSIYESG